MAAELMNVFNVIPCGSEDNGLLIRVLEFNKLPHYIEKGSRLLT
jgi:hypothetical protein